MGETGDGSSAAQRAQDIRTDAGRTPRHERGLLGRIFGPRNGEDDDDAEPLDDALTGPLPGLANLKRLRVEDVAIPKAEIVAAPEDIDRDDLVRIFRDSGFSRVPVYRDTLDKPIGLLLLKDLALRYGFNGKQALELEPLLRPVLFVPPSMPLAVLLQKMQSERTHMALVIDEYGGVDGLVTIEDLLEQVVGEIEDEHDTAEDGFFHQETPGRWLALSRTPLDDFERAIGFALAGSDDDEEIDTLGGLVFVLAGRVPARGEVIVHPSGTEFEIIDADPRRIKRLRVHLPAPLHD